MAARVFKRSAPRATKMSRRKVYATDHPHVFQVIGSDGHRRYTVALLPPIFMPPDPKDARYVCNCEAPAKCWHGDLVVERRYVACFVSPSTHRQEVANGTGN